MSIAIITLLLFSALVGALVVGVPIAFATGAVAVVFGVWLFDFNTLNLVVSRVFTLMGNQILVSVPLFILMATILEKAGIAEDIFKAAYIWSGKLRGGLAVAVVISCALMAAMVGVIGAEIVTMGVVALPAMLKRGYQKSLALGSICAGGGLATLIPPSVVFIMYALVAGTSIGQLYMAGIFPGLMLAGMYILYIIIVSYFKPEIAPSAPPEELNISLSQKLGYLRNLILPSLVSSLGTRFTLLWMGNPDGSGRNWCSWRTGGGPGESSLHLVPPFLRRGRHDQGDMHALLAILRGIGVDRHLYAGGRHAVFEGIDFGPAYRQMGNPDRDQSDLDCARRLDRLDRHTAADRTDFHTGSCCSWFRPDMARGIVLHEYADQLYIATFRTGNVLSQRVCSP
jgi:hypothetical protein